MHHAEEAAAVSAIMNYVRLGIFIFHLTVQSTQVVTNSKVKAHAKSH
jgi:hypothetical protein